MKDDIFILIIILINIIVCLNPKNNIIDWGIRNGVMISNFIELSSTKIKKRFVSNQEIQPKQKLLSIPYNLTFDIEKALNLIEDKDLNSQYEHFKNLDIYSLEIDNVNSQKEKIFLSYILYLIQHESQLEKTKLFERYKSYIETIKEYFVKSPLFYTSDQIEYLSGTFLGRTLEKIKMSFLDEIKVFKNESFYKKDLLFRDYALKRLFLEYNNLELLGHIRLIPFFNYLENTLRSNARVQIEENGDINIFSKGKIMKGDIISVYSSRRSNVEKFIFSGEVNPRYINYREKYIIPAFGPGLYYKYDIDDAELFKRHNIDLVGKEFYLQAVQLYKNNSLFFKGNDKDSWAYGILVENIEFYKNYAETFNKSHIEEIFEDFDDRKNIEIVMKGEAKLLGKAYTFIKNKFEILKNIENEKKNKKNTDL